MKKIFGLLALLLVFGCDDGDMTFETFNFTDAVPRTCADGKIYKVNGSEALVLNLSPENFINVPTNGTPRIVTVTTTSNTVQYLKYGADIESNHQSVICSSLPPLSPAEIWQANGGTIEITTIADTDPLTNIVTGYTHTVRLVYLSFTRNDESIIIQDNLFGDLDTQLGYTFNFNTAGVNLLPCPDDTDVLYIINQNEVLRMLLNNDALFINEAGGPREQLINAENKIFLDVYDGAGISQQQACGSQELNPQLIARWEAFEGRVQVTTTEPVTGSFSHQIKFVDMKFRNTSRPQETFTRTDYILGDTYDE